MEDVDETPARTTSGRRIPAAATVMQEQAEKKWHGTREHTHRAQAQAGISLGKRAHTRTLSNSSVQSSAPAKADLRVMTIEPRESDRNSHVPLARLL